MRGQSNGESQHSQKEHRDWTIEIQKAPPNTCHILGFKDPSHPNRTDDLAACDCRPPVAIFCVSLALCSLQMLKEEIKRGQYKSRKSSGVRGRWVEWTWKQNWPNLPPRGEELGRSFLCPWGMKERHSCLPLRCFQNEPFLLGLGLHCVRLKWILTAVWQLKQTRTCFLFISACAFWADPASRSTDSVPFEARLHNDGKWGLSEDLMLEFRCCSEKCWIIPSLGFCFILGNGWRFCRKIGKAIKKQNGIVLNWLWTYSNATCRTIKWWPFFFQGKTGSSACGSW